MSTQAIPHPHGVTVFGSSRVRVVPDLAEVGLVVARSDEKPGPAFAAAREAARAVVQFLHQAGVAAIDVATDRAMLEDVYKGDYKDRRHVGYQATIALRLVVRDLDRLETLITGAIEAGAHRIQGITLHSSKIAEVRAESRASAVRAARAKAELYAAAAGVRLGAVLHIEDRNPAAMQREFTGHTAAREELEADAPSGATPPGSVDVAAAVLVSFALLA